MKTELYLQIPKPCHENWDAMTPVNRGKFCASCNKEVVDFSLMSDVEVLNFFTRSTGNTCGRFNEDQLQRPLQETKIEKKKGWKWALASITSLIMISKSNAQKKEYSTQLLGKVKIEQPKKPIKGKTSLKIVPDTICLPTIQLQPQWLGEVVVVAPGRKITLKGIVVDKKNEPIPGATIYTYKDEAIGFTDEKGFFEVSTYAKGNKLSLSFKSLGYIDEHSTIDLLDEEIELKVFMTSKITTLPEVLVSAECSSRRLGGAVGYIVISQPNIIPGFIKKIFDSPVKIYPNPAAKNSTIYISTKDPGNYHVQLFDNTARTLHIEESSTTVKQQAISFRLPAGMASGMYYIRLTNIQTRKSYTEKLIVQ